MEGDDARYILRVEAGVDRLGFSPAGLPPDPVIVTRMEPNGWAEIAGVILGDELKEVDGIEVKTMSKQKLIQQLKEGERPMSLTFVRVSQKVLNPGDRVQVLKKSRLHGQFAVVINSDWNGLVKVQMDVEDEKGATKSFLPSELMTTNEPLQAKETEPHGMQALLTLPVGGRGFGNESSRGSNISTGSWRCSERCSCFNLTLSLNHMNIARYLSRHWCAQAALRDMLQELSGNPFVLTVPVGVTTLGFSIGSTESHMVCITRVDDFSWAQSHGMAVGDILLKVGLDFAAKVSRDDIVTSLVKVRPMQLDFLRPHDSNAGPVPVAEKERPPMIRRAAPSHVVPIGAAEEEEDTAEIKLPEQSSRKIVAFERRVSVSQTPPAHGGSNLAAIPDQEAAKTTTAKPKKEKDELSLPDGVPFTINVEDGVSRLGFVPSFTISNLDMLMVEVARVEASCWAEANGVMKGDHLLMIGDDPVATMNNQEVVTKLRDYNRPLALTLLRPHELINEQTQLSMQSIRLGAGAIAKAFANAPRYFNAVLVVDGAGEDRDEDGTSSGATAGSVPESSLEMTELPFMGMDSIGSSGASANSAKQYRTLGAAKPKIDALKTLAKKMRSSSAFVPGDQVEVYSFSQSAWCKGHVDSVNRSRVNVEYVVPGGGVSIKELPFDDSDLRQLPPELGPWPLDKSDGEEAGKVKAQVEIVKAIKAVIAARRKAKASASSFSAVMAKVLKAGDRVQVTKKSRLQGQFAVVIDSDWNGMVKVQMDVEDEKGKTKSFLPSELMCVTEAQVEKAPADPVAQQLVACLKALEASKLHVSHTEQLVRAEVRLAQADGSLSHLELAACNRLAHLALQEMNKSRRAQVGRSTSSVNTLRSDTSASLASGCSDKADVEVRFPEQIGTPAAEKETAGKDFENAFAGISSMIKEVGNLNIGNTFSAKEKSLRPAEMQASDQPSPRLEEVAGWFGSQITQIASMGEMLQSNVGEILSGDQKPKDGRDMEGWLEQRGPSVEYGWTSRWCVLADRELHIYTGPTCKEKRRSVLILPTAKIVRFTDQNAPGDCSLYRKTRTTGFCVKTQLLSAAGAEIEDTRSARFFYFDAGSDERLQAWVRALESCIARLKQDLKWTGDGAIVDPAVEVDLTDGTYEAVVWEGAERHLRPDFAKVLTNMTGSMVDKKKARSNTCDGNLSPRTLQRKDTCEEAPRGVSVHHLSLELLVNLIKVGCNEESTIFEVEEKVLRPKGAKVECPKDKKMGAAYVDCIKGNDHAGTSMYFVSHAWSDSIGDVTEALQNFCKNSGYHSKRTYCWMCSCCINQHRCQGNPAPSQEFGAKMKQRMNLCGNVLAICTSWNKPSYSCRAWCLLELYTAICIGPNSCKISVLVPPKQETDLCELLKKGRSPELETAWDRLGDVCFERAICKIEEDRMNIMRAVSDKYKLNESIAKVLQEWLVSKSEAHFTGLLAKGLSGETAARICEALSWMHQSSCRPERAAALLEEGLRMLASSSSGASSPYAARLFSCLGSARDDGEDLQGALEAYRNAYAVLRQHGTLKSPEGASLLHDMGLVQASLDQNEAAMKSYKDAYELRRELGILQTVEGALLLNSMGVARFKANDHKAALVAYGEAKKIREVTNSMATAYGASVLHNIGVVREALEDDAGALEAYRAAKRVHEKLGTLDSMDCYDTLEAIQALEQNLK